MRVCRQYQHSKLAGFATLFSMLLLLTGCAAPKTLINSHELPQLVGKRITVLGLAVHSCPGAALVCKGGTNVYIDGLAYWPKGADHQIVEVTGILSQRHAPDLFVVRNATWVLRGQAGSINAAQIRELQSLLHKSL